LYFPITPKPQKMRLLFSVLLSLIVWSASAQGKWVAILTEGSYYQGYKTFDSLEKCLDQVKELTREGNYITDLEYADGEWKLVYSADPQSSAQSWVMNEDFPERWLNEQKTKGYNIFRLAYGQFHWVAFARKQTFETKQLFKELHTWDEVISWLKKVWVTEPKYNIGDIAYGNGTWGVLLNYSSSEEHQVFTVSDTYPTAWMQQKFNDNYNISAIETDGEKWYVVMTRKQFQKSELATAEYDKFPSDRISQEWKKNKRITQLVYKIDPEEELLQELVNMGQKMSDKGNYSEAAFYYMQASELSPNNHSIWNNLAWALYNGGECELALSYAEKSLALKHTHFNLHTMAMILHCLDDHATALEYINKAIDTYLKENNKFDDATYYLDRAEIKFALKDKKGVLDDLKKAEAADPYNKVVTIRIEELKSKLN